jgi:PIN domain nuclease of toxin-antitoxin system
LNKGIRSDSARYARYCLAADSSGTIVRSSKRLTLDSTIQEFIAAVQAKLELIPLTAEIAICAAELPGPFHGDPMDRIITSTAIVGDCVLITHDDRIRKANVCKAVW